MNPTPQTDQYKELKDLVHEMLAQPPALVTKEDIEHYKQAILALIQDEVRKGKEEIKIKEFYRFHDYLPPEVRKYFYSLYGLSEGKE